MNIAIKKIINNISIFFRSFKKPGQSLTEKTVKGSFWIFSLRITDYIFNLIKIIILARILSPNDFGIFGIALLVLSIFGTFSQTGFNIALIQKKGDIKAYLNTAWTVGLIRGTLIALILVLLARPAAVFFAAPASEAIIRVIGISIFIQSINNIAILYYHKELAFGKFFKYQFLGTLTDVTVTITAALLLKSVWALLLGLIAGNVVKCIMSYVIEPYRPKFQFNRSHARELYSYGKWILGSSILIFLITHGDDIFVGKFLGVTFLGFYQMAYRISNTPATEITNVVSSVSFPLYAKLQDYPEKLKEAYLRTLKLILFLSFPLAGLIFILAPEFTYLFLGQKWMPAVPAIRVLAIAGLLRSFVASTIPVFRAAGRPAIETAWQIARFAVIGGLIYPLTLKYGILGTSIVIAISTFIACIGFSFAVIRIINCRFKDFALIFTLPLISSTIIVLVIYALKYPINSFSYPWFFVLLAISLLIFILINYLFDRYLKYGIFSTIKKIFGSLKRA